MIQRFSSCFYHSVMEQVIFVSLLLADNTNWKLWGSLKLIDVAQRKEVGVIEHMIANIKYCWVYAYPPPLPYSYQYSLIVNICGSYCIICFDQQ